MTLKKLFKGVHTGNSRAGEIRYDLSGWLSSHSPNLVLFFPIDVPHHASTLWVWNDCLLFSFPMKSVVQRLIQFHISLSNFAACLWFLALHLLDCCLFTSSSCPVLDILHCFGIGLSGRAL